jgi:hypothetical protein
MRRKQDDRPIVLSPLTLALLLIVLAALLVAVWIMLHRRPAAPISARTTGHRAIRRTAAGIRPIQRRRGTLRRISRTRCLPNIT